MTAVVRQQVGTARNLQSSASLRVGASLRAVRQKLPPADFAAWLEEDLQLAPALADQLMAAAGGATPDVLRPAELG